MGKRQNRKRGFRRRICADCGREDAIRCDYPAERCVPCASKRSLVKASIALSREQKRPELFILPESTDFGMVKAALQCSHCRFSRVFRQAFEQYFRCCDLGAVNDAPQPAHTKCSRLFYLLCRIDDRAG